MEVMMTGFVSLEEQVALLAKSMEILTANVKKKDEQLAFMMNKITSLTGKEAATSEQSQNPSLYKKKKNSAKAAKESQPKANEIVTPNHLKKLIKEAIKD